MKKLLFLIAPIFVGCSALKTESSLSIIETPDTEVLEKVLIDYSDNILTPEIAKKFDHSNLKIGYEYGVKSTPNSDDDSKRVFVYRLTEISSGKYYFSMLDSEGEIKRKNVRMLENGVMSIRWPGKKEYKPADAWEKCKFKEGLCTYYSKNGESHVMFSEFRNGVWLRNMEGTGKVRRPVKEVYDTNGLPLYYFTKSLLTAETVRVESN